MKKPFTMTEYELYLNMNGIIEVHCNDNTIDYIRDGNVGTRFHKKYKNIFRDEYLRDVQNLNIVETIKGKDFCYEWVTYLERNRILTNDVKKVLKTLFIIGDKLFLEELQRLFIKDTKINSVLAMYYTYDNNKTYLDDYIMLLDKLLKKYELQEIKKTKRYRAYKQELLKQER